MTLGVEDVAREGYRRLSAVAFAMAGVAAVIMVVWLLESLAIGFPASGWQLWGALAVLVLSSAIGIGSRRGWFPTHRFVSIALSSEILTAIFVSTPILGWQHRQGPDAVAWLLVGGEQPLFLGAGEVPWVGLWVILFATVIPLRPRQHLFGALLSILPLALLPVVSVWLTGLPPELEPGGLASAVHVSVWLSFRGVLAVGMAYAAARSVHGLRKRIARAQRMGSYQLRERLGAGGMGEVWKADHHMLARPAAIKLVRTDADAAGGPGMIERFEREVQATAQLRSPHTIEIYDYGLTPDGTFFYAMELLEGLDLGQLVREAGAIPWARVVHILRQVCHSLGEAHGRGVVHRDIKPANIFLCRVGRDLDQVKVLDFGLVRATAKPALDEGITQEGVFIGTPAYAAPEIATSAGTSDPRSDLYALGAVAYWLLAGRPVFEAASPIELLFMHAREVPPAVTTLVDEPIPAELDRIVLDCLAKDPGERPGSADELDRRLSAIEGASWTPEDAADWWSSRPPVA